MDRERFLEACRRIGLGLTEEGLLALEGFEDALYLENEVRNLTRVPRDRCWERHFLDSLLVHSVLPERAVALDVGCGPGFPCVPLAIARPDTEWVGLDSSGKMIGFLSRHRPQNVKPVCDRAETWGVRERFGFVTGRAVAPLPVQLELSAAPCALGGLVVPLRTPSDWDAIDRTPHGDLGLALERVLQAELPETGAKRVLPIYRKVRATPPAYPRSWAEMRRRPLGSR
ncbi:MAG: class I SAM-dependent methyltransferase [Fimbriimonadales bacterium]|nr:class I SAM-dependent methyltransferase [Fimbriimonadales bacterium]